MQLTPDQLSAEEALLSFLNSDDKCFVLKGYAGTGKEQPISTYVQTPKGAVRFGDIKLGDYVFTQSGKPTLVTGVYPQGVKPVYKITFRDGTSTRCGLDHIWWVYSAKPSTKPKQMTTRELIEKGLTFKSGHYKYRIPLCEAVEYPKKSMEFDPYLIGVLIGDGYLAGNTPAFSCTDTDIEIYQEIRANLDLSYKIHTGHTSTCKQYLISDSSGYKVNRLKNHLNSLGLNVLAKDKHIPKEYLLLDTPNRIRLLQGLMDTDGTSRNNRISYSTVSYQLALDVQTLVQSLGGTAILHTYDRTSQNKGIEYTINVKTSFNPFRLARKAKNWKYSYKNPPSRYITDISLDGEEEQMCIMVDDLSHLYLTDHFIVTHNTTLIKHLINSFALKEKLLKVIDPNYIAKEWALSATTNKAAEALSTATGMDTTTVHSLLDIKVRNDYETGHTYSYRRKDAEVKDNLIIVIDECSYIDTKLLSIINHATSSTCKVIFMGDPSQLTPVGSNEVPVFNQDYPSATLSQVVRQDTTNPIQEICANLRKTIQESVGFPKISLSAEILHLTKEDFETEIAKEFSRPEWRQGDSKILAWRNRTVQQYNTAVFKHINNRSEFKKGDYVLNNHFVSGLKADTEYMIEKCYACTAYNNTEGFNVQVVGKLEHLFLPKNIKDYDKAKKRALKENDSSRVKEIMEDWVDLRPSYACTINKSQGSTYNKVFIDLSDLAKCRDALQLARLLYVAISRARYQVIFTGDLG